MAGRPEDHTGKRYGRLTCYGLVSLTDEGRVMIRHRGRAALWLCRCDCGRWVPVASANLISGNTTGCGVCYWQTPEAREMSRRNGVLGQTALAEKYTPEELAAIRRKAARKGGRRRKLS